MTRPFLAFATAPLVLGCLVVGSVPALADPYDISERAGVRDYDKRYDRGDRWRERNWRGRYSQGRSLRGQNWRARRWAIRTPLIDQRLENQTRRLKRKQQRGRIAPRLARQIAANLDEVTLTKRRLGRDGVLTRRERQTLRQMLRRNGRMLRRASVDGVVPRDRVIPEYEGRIKRDRYLDDEDDIVVPRIRKDRDVRRDEAQEDAYETERRRDDGYERTQPRDEDTYDRYDPSQRAPYEPEPVERRPSYKSQGPTPNSVADRALVSFPSWYRAGEIVVSFGDKRLYHVLSDGQAMSYPIAVPRPSARWQGVQRVTRKAVNPSWTPTNNMRRENPKLPAFVAGGDPRNPLGVRALYLGRTLYRIHGTDAPWTIGKNVSKGCIRMHNAHVIELYNKVKVGTKVTATTKRFGAQPVAALGGVTSGTVIR